MTPAEMRDFYAIPHVHQRLREFISAAADGSPSCMYLAQPDQGWPLLHRIRDPRELPALMAEGLDISRSLWDRDSLLAHLDIEYVNFEFPDEPYIDPERAFRLQTDVCAAVERLLGRHGIRPLHVVSGRGHHYSWLIGRQTTAFRVLRDLGHCNDSMLGRYRHTGLPMREPLPPELGTAFAGLGMVVEYLAGRVKVEASRTAPLPVRLTAVAVPPGERGSEMVSLDVSEYGDPLYLRVIRLPFSGYMKRITERRLRGDGFMLTTVTNAEIPMEKALTAMRSPADAADLAAAVVTTIPDASDASAGLVADYTQSDHYAFHEQFYAEEQHTPGDWERTYDRTDLKLLPRCVANILMNPNDLLMKPAGLELVVRTLLALEWHPRHIAGLIRSRYERDFGWCDHWLIHDAATRADFYTRLFAGLIVTGADDLSDFNHDAIRARGMCVPFCDGCDMEGLRERLLERKAHG